MRHAVRIGSARFAVPRRSVLTVLVLGLATFGVVFFFLPYNVSVSLTSKRLLAPVIEEGSNQPAPLSAGDVAPEGTSTNVALTQATEQPSGNGFRAEEVKDPKDEGFRFTYTTLGLDPRLPVPPGDMGEPVKVNLSDPEIATMISEGMKRQGFNQYSSDMMSVRRRLPEIRDPWCAEPGRFLADLPATSVVIVFFNEAWSVVLRTIHSVLDRSPPQLVNEIVLVDDCSSLPNLRAELDEYFRSYQKVRVIRAPKRLGLIRARIFGAKNTTSDVITFLDAHVECTIGWLEALIDVVARNATTIAIPTIDWIDEKTMALISDKAPIFVGAYDWDLNFGWWGRWSLHKKHENKIEPFDTPAMAGGLFTIKRAFFERLGWYDEGFDIYGIENIELSMKSWMCGGKMVTVPCSRVAHIQKAGHPYLNNEKKDVVRSNTLRLAEVWMDEYKQVIFDIHGIPHYLEEEFGSVAERKAVRERANCRDFRYYIETAFPEMHSPFIEGSFRGEVHNTVLGDGMCLEWRPADAYLGMSACDGKQRTQYWTHNYYEELNSYRNCIDFTGSYLGVYGCHRSRGNQAWKVHKNTGLLESVKYSKCLALDLAKNTTLKMEECDAKRDAQRWILNFTVIDVSPFKSTP
ncbi:putative polypeptide N-acetylgalactosaminyltransferase 9 [Anopheles bellator]|uniref:putative polypeptide N-acetylgalactosaminyltransferase 9 n=1 Tax=Anopheles bellator TaxID=139047 RepID=UPI0026482970|nr:putative polypeptide N-acetylgalactosaminyltransferase 9 [Anopheles bellator]